MTDAAGRGPRRDGQPAAPVDRPRDPSASRHGEAEEWREVGAPDADTDGVFDELRSLLVGEERDRLAMLEQEPRRPTAADVADVLPEAVRRRVARDHELPGALAQTIEDGLHRSVRRDPQALADAIHPALGPAIRKSIQSTLAQALESFNVALENSLSPRGVAWRIEALRTGRPFAEVVLLKSLVYRVEQVFLLHRDSGVLLAEAASPEALRRDPEVVSSMLGALRDFVSDSFGADPDESLDRIDIAGMQIVLVANADIVLAGVVRGTAPPSVRDGLEEALEEVTLRTGDALEGFGGDCAPFEAQRHLLERCLGGEERPRERSRLLRAVAPGVAAVLIVLGVVAIVRGVEDRRSAARVERALRSAPGYLVLGVGREDGVRTVRGLRDPLAAPPQELAARAEPGFDGAEWRFELAAWAAPELLPERAAARLRAPTGVDVSVESEEDGVSLVRVEGDADRAWISELPERFAGLSGAAGPSLRLELDASGLVDRDGRALEEELARLEDSTLRFDVGRSELLSEDPLTASALERVAELGRRAERAGRLVRLTLMAERHPAEGGSAELAARRVSASRSALAEVAGAWVLFETRLPVDSDVPVGDSGGVRLLVEVLGPVSAAPAAPGQR